LIPLEEKRKSKLSEEEMDGLEEKFVFLYSWW